MMKKIVIPIIFLVTLLGICFTFNHISNNGNNETKGTYGRNILMGGKPGKRIIDSIQLSKAQSANTNKNVENFDNDDFIEKISNLIKEGKVLKENCTEYYIYKEPIYELCYVFPGIYQDEDDTECKQLQGVRYVVASQRDFSDAEAIVYNEDDSMVRKEYMLSKKLLKEVIETKNEYGVIVSENRGVLIDDENNVTEQHVNDKIYFLTNGDCFSELKDKGYIFDTSGIDDDDKVVKSNVK